MLFQNLPTFKELSQEPKNRENCIQLNKIMYKSIHVSNFFKWLPFAGFLIKGEMEGGH